MVLCERPAADWTGSVYKNNELAARAACWIVFRLELRTMCDRLEWNLATDGTEGSRLLGPAISHTESVCK